MEQSKIKPEEITRQIQNYAVWFVGLLLLETAFLTSATLLKDSSWLPVALVITAIAIIPVFVVTIFILQTKYRTQFLDDPYYAEWLKRQEEQFKDFKPEKVQSLPVSVSITPVSVSATGKVGESWEEREHRRIRRYEGNRGLFLVHTWRPSRTPEQEADVSISLHQHGDGPLTQKKIKSVEYHLGPKFFAHTVTKTDPDDNFALHISAYGPILCLAQVNFDDGSPPLDLERYINF